MKKIFLLLIVSVVLISCEDKNPTRYVRELSDIEIKMCRNINHSELEQLHNYNPEAFFTCASFVRSRPPESIYGVNRREVAEIAVKATKLYLKEKEQIDTFTEKALVILKKDKKVIFETVTEIYVSGQYSPMKQIETTTIVNYDEVTKKFCREEAIEIICDVLAKDGYSIQEKE